MPQYEESTLRRTPFSQGYGVELADGQRWTMPALTMRVFPYEEDDGTIAVLARPVYAEDMESELDILFGVTAGGFGDMLDAKMRIATRLLRSNYDLPKGAVGRLLSYQPGDPASERVWSGITRAILGRDPAAPDQDEEGDVDGDPKGPTPDGSASP